MDYFQFQMNASGGSGFNETITSSSFMAEHTENNGSAQLLYRASDDQAQGTDYQDLMPFGGNATVESGSGELHLFNPSSTTYIKNFYATGSNVSDSPGAVNSFNAGYFNVTSALDEISFRYHTGNITAGKIKMYGVK